MSPWLSLAVIRLRAASLLAPELGQIETHRMGQIRDLRDEKARLEAHVSGLQAEIESACTALRSIVARATKWPNSTVKAMVEIAQRALK